MNAVPFDTLKLADRLEAGGFTAEQARAVASAMADTVSIADLATKADLAQQLAETKADILKWVVSTIGIQTVVIIGAVLALMRMSH